MRIICYGSFIDYQMQLANTLSKDNEVIIVLPMNKLPTEYSGILDKKVSVHLLGRGKALFHPTNLLVLKDTIQMIQRFRPDVIHMQLGGGKFDLALLPFFKKYPLVATFHDVILHVGEESRMVNFIRHWLRKYSDEIIVHGKKLREQMILEYNIPSEKVHAIHIGEHEVAPFKKYERIDIKEAGNLILFFGRIYPYKGLEYLIRAEPLITKELPNAKIVIAGAGRNFEKYKKMMGSRSDSFIVRNYHISYQEGAELFQRSSLVVLPYIQASQSGVVPTAYGFKKPVVVTNVGSIPEIVDDNRTGIIVPPRDSQALAEAVVRLLKNEKLRKGMGENAYKKLKEDFSWERIIINTVKVYNKAIADAKKK
ncbi:glycosyltransferase family 4 protein [Chloroflexota bacterium]